MVKWGLHNETQCMTLELDISGVCERIRRSEITPELIAYVDSDTRPLGLNFSDLFHSVDADQAIGLAGQNVLEIGGALSCNFALGFLDANEWSCIEYGGYIPPSKQAGLGNQLPRTNSPIEQRKYHYYNCKAHEFRPKTDNFARYTRVYSIAAFEHIGNLLASLDHIATFCDTGSLLYAYFTPIWSDPAGHHLGKEIIDLIGPWGHLANTPQQLRRWILDQGLDHREVDTIIYNIYKDPHINRNMPTDYELIFMNSSWKPIEIRPINKLELNQLPTSTQQRVMSHYPLEKYLCSGYRVILRLI